jgi:hypothetical protein
MPPVRPAGPVTGQGQLPGLFSSRPTAWTALGTSVPWPRGFFPCPPQTAPAAWALFPSARQGRFHGGSPPPRLSAGRGPVSPPPPAAMAAGFAGERPRAPGTASGSLRFAPGRPARRVLRCGDPAAARGCPPCPALRALRTPADVYLPGCPAACGPGFRVRLRAFRTSPARIWLVGGASSPGPPVPPVLRAQCPQPYPSEAKKTPPASPGLVRRGRRAETGHGLT